VPPRAIVVVVPLGLIAMPVVVAAAVPLARGEARTAIVDPMTKAADVHRFVVQPRCDLLFIPPVSSPVPLFGTAHTPQGARVSHD
jgi:hypothetical protein